MLATCLSSSSHSAIHFSRALELTTIDCKPISRGDSYAFPLEKLVRSRRRMGASMSRTKWFVHLVWSSLYNLLAQMLARKIGGRMRGPYGRGRETQRTVPPSAKTISLLPVHATLVAEQIIDRHPRRNDRIDQIKRNTFSAHHSLRNFAKHSPNATSGGR